MNPDKTGYLEALKAAQSAPRCLAKTRRETLCQCPAMQNGRCYKHGGKVVRQMGAENGRYIDGRYAQSTLDEVKSLNQFLTTSKSLKMPHDTH